MKRVERRESAEVVVIGGGAIGLALAYELSRAGRSVLVVEREWPGAGASAAAGGMLAPISEAEFEPPELIALGQDSLRRFPAFLAGVERLAQADCGYRDDGTLWVALEQDGLAELRRVEELLRGKALAVRPLDAAGVRALEPHVSGRALGGLEVSGDHQVDPRRLCRSLVLAAERLGCRVLVGAAVESVETERGRACGVAGKLEDGRLLRVDAPTVVVAAGAWSGRDISLPLPPLGLRPVKGQLVRLRGPRLLRRVLRTPEAYLVPRADGELLIGATMEEMGFERAATAGAIMDLLRSAWAALPGIYDLELVEVSVGLRSAVDDGLPVIGATAVGGLFLAFGHFRNGILLAPATGHYLARWIVEGREPAELGPFAPSRLMRENAVRRG